MKKIIKHVLPASLALATMVLLTSAAVCWGWPSEFDWRDHNGNWMTPVKNQGNCGSPWAFVAVALAESRIKIALGDTALNPDLSEQHLVSCNTESPNSGCGGGNVYVALDFMHTNGIAVESSFPYIAENGFCRSLNTNWQDSAVKVTGYRMIHTATRPPLMDSIRTIISTTGPVGADLMVHASFMSYDSGVITEMTGALQGGICVLVVGYSDSGSYWICKNSWSPSWGENGYFRIGYNITEFLANNYCYVVTATDHDSAATGLSIPNREALSMELSVSPSPFTSTTRLILPGNIDVKEARVRVYDMAGKEVARFPNVASSREIAWNASNLPSGTYVVKLVSGRQAWSRKTILMR